jgi:4-hydroxybenzoyl-CoA reductase subunit beta
VILPPFELHRPSTLEEALDLARAAGDDFDFMGGGTDLRPNYKNRLNPRRRVISLANIEELRILDGCRIGAGVTVARLETDPEIVRRWPVLSEAASRIASPLIRESGTVGGNLLVETRCTFFNQSLPWRRSKGYCMKADGDVCLVVPQKEVCYATYSGDLAPVFMVLGATLHLLGPGGGRQVPISSFYRPDGILKHVLKKGEILTHVEIDEGAERLRAGHAKLRMREAFDFPEMGVAAALRLEDGKLVDLRAAASAMEVVPLEFPEAAGEILGEEPTPERIRVFAKAAAGKVRPVKNTALPPPYRKRMFPVFLTRLLDRLLERETAAARAR